MRARRRRREHALGKATDSLGREHRVIQKAVAVMARIADQLEMHHPVSANILQPYHPVSRANLEGRLPAVSDSNESVVQ